jgi:hypothetical protein
MTTHQIKQLELFFVTVCHSAGSVPRKCHKCDFGKEGACNHPLNPMNREKKKDGESYNPAICNPGSGSQEVDNFGGVF